MLKARHHRIIYPFFKWLSCILIKRNFSNIHITGEFNDNGKAVLIVANHISWWDGFWIMHMNRKTYNRKFHFMMLEEQLTKHWYFQFCGGFSIKKQSKGIIESIQYTAELLKQKENAVLLFPQGRIHSLYADTICFERGVEKIIRNCQPDTQVLFTASLPDYFSKPKPDVYMYQKSLIACQFTNTAVEEEYRKFYSEALAIQKSLIS